MAQPMPKEMNWKTLCKKCGAKVRWKKVEGRWQCFNLDGVIHWDTCSKNRWDQVKRTGQRFEEEMRSGFKRSMHGDKFDHIGQKEIIGKDYKPDGCKCGLPPWELCKPDCEHRIGGESESVRV